jgi:hypothetical protein
MTVYSEDWFNLPETQWVQADNAEPFSASGGLLVTSVQQSYIGAVLTPFSGFAVTSVATLTEIDLGVPHGYPVSEFFQVRIYNNSTTGPSINGSHTALAISANAFTIAVDTSSAVIVNDGFVYMNPKGGGLSLASEQEIQGTFLASSIVKLGGASVSYGILWGRMSPNVAPLTSLTAGYGCQLEWTETDGTRTLRLLKLVAPGVFIVLASTDDAHLVRMLLQPDGTDFEIAQFVRFTITDEPLVGGQPRGVRLRAWVNSDDDAGPAIEWVDRGGGAAPLHDDGGTWAITLGDPSCKMDAFEATDSYQVPDHGTGVKLYRTKAETRALVKAEVSRGTPTNLDDARVDQAVEEGIAEFLNDLGDSATFRRRLDNFTLGVSDDLLVTLPSKVEQVYEIYDTQSKRPVRWHKVDDGVEGEIRVYIADEPGGASYLVEYAARWSATMEDDDEIPIPKRHDEGARVAAMWRLVDNRRDREYRQTLLDRYNRLVRKTIGHFQKLKRAEKPHLTIDAGTASPGGLIGGIVKRRGPF